MNTSEIKKFATAARRLLLQGVRNKLLTLGFNENGQVTLAQLPVLAYNDTNFNGRIIPGKSFYYQWTALQRAINEKGISNICEEAAYTWFNRLVAIRILQKQEKNLIRNVLDFVDDSRTPAIVHDARHGIINGVSDAMRGELDRLLLDDTKTTEQFSILISAFCEDTPLLSKIFGRINDYTELLLPNDILNSGGFIDLLNNSTYITDEDYLKTELIGWLYQFYISDRKVEAYQNNGEWSVEEVEAGTQIFTPNWIVKYMVENTLGRIYLDKYPDAGLKNELKYLVQQSAENASIYKFERIEDLRCADLSSGSGHILAEFFELLFRLYEEEWYDNRTAIENIFKYNLVGIDLDTRAKQLSTFSLLLKACQKDESFVDAEVMPQVLDMPSVKYINILPIINKLFVNYNADIKKEVVDAFKLMENANELGSIMKFKLSESSRQALSSVVNSYRQDLNAETEIIKSIDLMLTLTEHYSAICMNPPYMGSTHMNTFLKSYVGDNYPDTKADLFAVFMDVAIERLKDDAKYGMINMQNWMFIPAFKNLRPTIIDQYHIDSLIQLGTHLFDELNGERVQSVSFIITKHISTTGGTYFRLIEGKNCSEKEALFLNKHGVFQNIDQQKFNSIPNNVFGFWLNDNVISTFANRELSSLCTTRCGLATGRNDYYIRKWHEVNYSKIGRFMNRTSAQSSQLKWFPYNCAGGFRKWYGFQTDIINWYNDGFEMQNTLDPSGKRIWAHNFNLDQIFREHIGWSDITTGANTFRYYPEGFLFTSNAAFPNNHKYTDLLLAFANSCIAPYFKKVLNPGLHFTPGNFEDLPFCYNNLCDIHSLKFLAEDCLKISKQDWDAHETSWDFRENELIQIYTQYGGKLEDTVNRYIKKWSDLFQKLHNNEEELNRQLIDIYGLKNELIPNVPLDQISILQQKEIRIENEQVQWDKSVLIKQFISYAMGCWMGRYRLDKPSLNIAHPNPSAEELATYEVNGKTFDIDDDGIVPLMDEESPFADNAVSRMKDFVGAVFGEDHLAENLNYIRECLGMTLEKFFQTVFWKDHLARYQKRPIYWLFQSNNRNPAFQVVVYMHRMDAYSCEKVRTYLLSYIDYLKQRINQLEQNEGTLSPAETRKLIKMKDNLKECLSYEERLHHVANQQIAFDLDDGVKVNYAKFGDVLAAIS